VSRTATGDDGKCHFPPSLEGAQREFLKTTAICKIIFCIQVIQSPFICIECVYIKKNRGNISPLGNFRVGYTICEKCICPAAGALIIHRLPCFSILWSKTEKSEIQFKPHRNVTLLGLTDTYIHLVFALITKNILSQLARLPG